MSIFNGKNKAGDSQIFGLHQEGLPDPSQVQYAIAATEEGLDIRSMGKGGPSYLIAWSKVKNVIIAFDRETKQKGKSAVGRGLVGGAVAGPAGMVLGGLSGTGTKEKTVVIPQLLIDYESNGEQKRLLFSLHKNAPGDRFVKRFLEDAQSKAGLSKPEEPVML